MRDSIHETSEKVVSTKPDKGDAEAIDPKPGISRYLYILYAIVAILIVFIIGYAKSKYPAWYAQNKNAIDKITFFEDRPTRILYTASKLVKNLGEKGKDKISIYTGTGTHPEARKNKDLRENYTFYTDSFVKKDYVRELEMLPQSEVDRLNKKGGLNFPVIDKDWIEADQFCRSLGSGYRLPYYSELEVANDLITKTNAIKNGTLSFNLRRNLQFKAFETKCEWTATKQPLSGGLFSFISDFEADDNYRVWCAGKIDERFEDDTYSDEDLLFRCAKDPK